MKLQLRCCLVACCMLTVGIASAQETTAPKEAAILKNDVGTWDCVVSMWPDPAGEPMKSKGTETNRMVGDYWLISEFKGEVMEMAFSGAGQFGYNPDTKKYVGVWVDSMGPYPMHMEGTWDEATKTMTQFGSGKDPSGAEMKSKSTVVYKDDNHHTMTMYAQTGENQWTKMLEIVYTRRASANTAK